MIAPDMIQAPVWSVSIVDIAGIAE